MEIKEAGERASARPAAAAETAVGAADTVVELVTRPGATARSLRARGRLVDQRVARGVRETAQTAGKAADGTLPERWLILGARIIKRQARRSDVVGFMAYRGISLLHGGLEQAVGSLTRLEQATRPPARPAGQPEVKVRASVSRPRSRSRSASEPVSKGRAPRRSRPSSRRTTARKSS